MCGWAPSTLGGGQFAIANGAEISNYGTFVLDSPQSWGFIKEGTQAAVFNNQGGVIQSGVGGTAFSGLAFNNQNGLVDAHSGSLSFSGGYTQTAVETRLSGGSIWGNLDIQAGTLTGSGPIYGSVTNQGRISPGFFAGAVGAITVSGNYVQPAIAEAGGSYTVDEGGTVRLAGSASNSKGALDIEIGGPGAGVGFDQLQVSYNVTLGGTLNVSLIGGFSPAIGQELTIIDKTGSGAIVGAFAGLDEGAVFAVGGSKFRISYVRGTGNDVVLTAVDPGTSEHGGTTLLYEWDLDGDNIFGETGANAERGDEIGLAPLFSAVDLAGPATVPVSFRINGGPADTATVTVNNLPPSRIQCLVWEDFNDDGLVDFGEEAIEGASVRLTGTDDRGGLVDMAMATDAQGLFEFTGLRPGTYMLTETQPAGYVDGQDALGTVNGIPTGSAAVNDKFSAIVLPRPGSDAVNYNFGERPAPDGPVGCHQTATIGFWQNKHGQNLIKALNGASTSTQLANWLAAAFPNMYGASAGANNLSGMTNTQVADFYTLLFKRNAKTSPGGPPKLDAQVMATALAVYVTNADLAGTTAASYGFRVTDNGAGVSTIQVSYLDQLVFGLELPQENQCWWWRGRTTVTVMDLLLATDEQTRSGLLFDLDGNGRINWLETIYRTIANCVFESINERGHID